MDKINLAHTGLNVSRLCFGAITFGGQTDEPTSVRMVEHCLDNRINFFDTANVYNNGMSEVMLGRALKGRRHRAILASKVFGKMGDGPDQRGLSAAAIRRAIDESLRRLETDYLDIYYLHSPDYGVPIEESLAAMNQLVKDGKVRHMAQSNYAAWQACQMLWISDKCDYPPPMISQPMYNLLARGIEQEYLPMCRQFGIATVVYNPLAGGLLTGKQTSGAPIRGSRFDKNRMYLDRYWHDEYFHAVESVRQIARRANRSMVSVSLNWLLHHMAITCVIIGASRLEHLKENITAAEDGPLDSETVTGLDEVWKRLRGVTPQYNR